MRSILMETRSLSPEAAQGGAYQMQHRLPVTRGDRWLWYALDRTRATAPYAPDVEPHLLDAFLEVTDADGAEQFARHFGPVGWEVITARETTEKERAKSRNVQEFVSQCPPRHTGDPIPWVLGHAAAMNWCQTVWQAQQQAAPRVLMLDEVPQCPIESARRAPAVGPAVATLLTQFADRVRLVVALEPGFTLRLGWGGHALLDALWMLLARRLSQGRLVRCQRPGCGKVFSATDARQRFCPPSWETDTSAANAFDSQGRKRRSPCSEIMRQRELRARWRAQGLTSRGTPRKASAAPSAQDSTSRAPSTRGTRKR